MNVLCAIIELRESVFSYLSVTDLLNIRVLSRYYYRASMNYLHDYFKHLYPYLNGDLKCMIIYHRDVQTLASLAGIPERVLREILLKNKGDIDDTFLMLNPYRLQDNDLKLLRWHLTGFSVPDIIIYLVFYFCREDLVETLLTIYNENFRWSPGASNRLLALYRHKRLNFDLDHESIIHYICEDIQSITS